MNPVDVRAEHWRQEQEILRDAKVLELQAQLDQTRKALQRKAKSTNIRLRGELPTWQKWIVYPIGALILWDCLRVVFFGGPMR